MHTGLRNAGSITISRSSSSMWEMFCPAVTSTRRTRLRRRRLVGCRDRTRMDAGLDLVGQDVGTPIIAMEDGRGGRVGIFGPVITEVPPREESLRLWDVVVQATRTPSFWS